MLNHVCLSALLLTGLLQQPPTEAGWTSLFNGNDFTGWKISKPESFKIENGAIVANGVASHAYYDGPFRNHNFKNFEVKVDVMTRSEFERRRLCPDRVRSHWGQRPYVREFPVKGIRDPGQQHLPRPIKTGSLYHVSDSNEAVAKDEEWFTIHIVVKDKNIVVKVNDKQTVDWTQPADWNGGREGPGRAITGAGGTIALQAHDPHSTVYLKNIRIKPLD